MNRSLLTRLSVVAIGFSLFTHRTHAAAIATDDASDLIYNSGWSNGQNGGSGFGAWQLSNGAHAGFFVFTSQNNGSGDGNIDTGGRSWGLFANSGDLANAVRPFTAGGSNGSNLLGPGETFLASLDNGFIDNGSSVGVSLQNSLGANEFQFIFNGGSNNYLLTIGATVLDTGIGFTSKGLALKFTQGVGNSWSLDVTPNGGVTTTFTDASAGSAPLPASDISQVRIFNSNAGNGGTNDAFANSMQVVPEPGAAVAVAGGVVMLGLMGRMRRRR
jgi:hypothetical protein